MEFGIEGGHFRTACFFILYLAHAKLEQQRRELRLDQKPVPVLNAFHNCHHHPNTMPTQNEEPKYCDPCGSTDHTDKVALAACRRLLKPDDLGWLFRDLQMCWDHFREHLPEFALSVGAQFRYVEHKVDSETPSRQCVSAFLKAAVFLFYADAVQQIENAKRPKPIELEELSTLVRKNLKEALRPTTRRAKRPTAKSSPRRKLILD